MIDPLLFLVLWIKLPSTSNIALFVKEPVPIGPLVALPRLPTEVAANFNVPALLIVPPEYVLNWEVRTNIPLPILVNEPEPAIIPP